MRFTLDPGGDIEVPEGLSLGRCRPALVRLTGSAELASAALRVDGRLLADDHPAGTPPWVHGSRLSTADEPDPAALALAAPWHVAVTSGPDAGRLAVPGRDGTVVVGRGTDRGPGRLSLRDATVSREHLVLRHRRRRHGRAEAWLGRDLGSANGTTAARPSGGGRRVRHLGRWARRIRPEEPLGAGASRLEVRRRPVDAQGAGEGPGPQGGASARGPVPVSSWLVPAVASLALAAATRNPVFLLALGGPLGLALPELIRSARGRGRRRTEAGQTSELGPGPAAVSVELAARWTAHRTPRGPVPVGPAGSAGSVDEPTEQPPPWWRPAEEGLALVGPRAVVLAAARGLLGGGLLDRELRLAVLAPTTEHPQWAWCRWLDHRLLRSWSAPVAGAAGAGRRLVVSDGLGPWRPELTRWWSTRPAGSGLLLLLDQAEQPPAWCRHVLRLDDVGRPLTGGLTGSRDLPRGRTLPAAPAWWIEEHARRVAALDHAPRLAGSPGSPGSPGFPGDGVPARVALADLDLPQDLDALLHRWRADDGRPGLVTTIGVGPVAGVDGGAEVVVDLLADGPHALVAGTTGAGKSELLQSLLLGLALRYPPSRVAMVLVDYKGGTSFGRCPDLPHVIGQVTDLDQTEAARALDGLRAELHRRERLLAEHGVNDLDALRRQGRAEVPPRLLVVVDEFRALTEDLPEFVPGLVRLAAQGRSLGIHLVLATQRPAGAVSAQMRANVGLRLCLRVTDAADSVDVVEVPDAAELPVDRPGRALLRRGPARPELVQTAWAALHPGAWRPTSTPADPALVRWAPGWAAWTPVPPDHATPPAQDRPQDHTAVLVDLARQAAVTSGTAPPARVWLPPLPTTLSLGDLASGPALPAPDVDRLLIGITDLPGEQRRGPLAWHHEAGPLVVAGRPGSGRTTALRTVASAALARGWHVHLVGGGGVLPGDRAHPGLGTVVGPDDPRRLARLLTVLATAGSGPAGPARLLVVDDWGTVSAALERLPRGLGTGLLEPLLRDGRHHRLAVAVAGTPAEVLRLLPHAGERLVLTVADPHEDGLLGVPRALATDRPTPGRAVHLSAAGAVRCQVALAGVSPASPVGRPAPADRPAPTRLLPLPLVVERAAPADRPDADPGTVLLGVGDDDAGPVTVATGRWLLVVGPAGSGRSTALATVTFGLWARGQDVVVVARAGPLALVGSAVPDRYAGSPERARHLLTGPHPPRFVVVDDVDTLARAAPDLDDLLADWAAAAETGRAEIPRVLASARTDRAAASYRGSLAALRGAADVLVLSPVTAGSADVAGADLGLCVDPIRPLHPGRGVLVRAGRPISLQVASG